MVVRVLQLTDTHLFSSPEERMKGVKTYTTLKEVIELVHQNDESYDFVVLTGDISQDETANSYQHVAQLISTLRNDVFYIPGNHDDKEVMHSVFEGFDKLKRSKRLDRRTWRFIFLDSAIQGRVEGELDDQELSDLKRLIEEESDKHVAIFLHHNPVNLDPTRVDPVMLKNSERFFSTLNDRVRAVICGHVHQDYTERRGNLVFISSPSTCVQFKPTLDGVSIDEKPPGYRILEFLDSSEVKTRVERLGEIPQGLGSVEGS